jgi:hypothetical protein
MSTTIQTSKRTAQQLRELMKKTGAKTYDELISRLVSEKYHTPVSLFGSNPELKSFAESDEVASHDL